MFKCTYADRYQAFKKPTCGCQTCTDKYVLHVADRILHNQLHDDPYLIKALAANIIEVIGAKKK